MADSPLLVTLLGLASYAFSLAGRLGRALYYEQYYEQSRSETIIYDPEKVKRHEPIFHEFCKAVLELRDAIQNPPDGFSPVPAGCLRQPGLRRGFGKRLHVRETSQYAWTTFLNSIRSACLDGKQ